MMSGYTYPMRLGGPKRHGRLLDSNSKQRVNLSRQGLRRKEDIRVINSHLVRRA